MLVSDDLDVVVKAGEFKKDTVDPAETLFDSARKKLTAEYLKRWETNDNIIKKIKNNNLSEDMLDFYSSDRTAWSKLTLHCRARRSPTLTGNNGWL